jgi:hypothetical protein
VSGLGWQDLAVAAVVLAAAAYVLRRFVPRKRKTTVAFIPLKELRPRGSHDRGAKKVHSSS